jgi:hypothetical protein
MKTNSMRKEIIDYIHAVFKDHKLKKYTILDANKFDIIYHDVTQIEDSYYEQKTVIGKKTPNALAILDPDNHIDPEGNYLAEDTIKYILIKKPII